MALADWTPERMARFEADLAVLAKVNTVAEKYATDISQHNDLDMKRWQAEDMHSALRFGHAVKGWNGQEVPENASVRQFMQEWYENEGMSW
jgi:hypothetical protein